MKKQVVPYVFEGFLILALHSDWIKEFGEIPKFEVIIGKDKKLHLVSVSTLNEIKTKKN